jgi:hypothetical protein
MTTDTTRRHDLYEHARATWGATTAETLMELLPPDREHLATKTDVRLLKTDIRLLKADMDVLGAELRGEMAILGADLRTEMGDLRTEMHVKFADQTRTLMVTMVSTMLSGVALAFTAAHFA